MLKRIATLALVLLLAIGLVGCGNEEPKVNTQRPADWDVEAEALLFCNGYYRAKTPEELKPYVLSSTSDKRIKEIMDLTNASLSGMDANSLDFRDYPYDAVEVTVLETYKGYDICWINMTSSAIEQAVEELNQQNQEGSLMMPVSYTQIGPVLVALAIENGHYVTTLDESLSAEVLNKYSYCQTCYGQGAPAPIADICMDCSGGQKTTATCQDCNEEFTPTLNSLTFIPDETQEGNGSFFSGITSSAGSDSLVSFAQDSQCPNCGSTNISIASEICETCQGNGFIEPDVSPCSTCDGKGWIKN